MANDTKPFNQNGYLMLNGPDDTLWIPRSSNKSWLTLFYALPREMVDKQKEYLSLPRCPYDVLRTEKYDELIRGLETIAHIGMVHSSFQMGMEYDFARPRFYNKLFKAWGLDEGKIDKNIPV